MTLRDDSGLGQVVPPSGGGHVSAARSVTAPWKSRGQYDDSSLAFYREGSRGISTRVATPALVVFGDSADACATAGPFFVATHYFPRAFLDKRPGEPGTDVAANPADYFWWDDHPRRHRAVFWATADEEWGVAARRFRRTAEWGGLRRVLPPSIAKAVDLEGMGVLQRHEADWFEACASYGARPTPTQRRRNPFLSQRIVP